MIPAPGSPIKLALTCMTQQRAFRKAGFEICGTSWRDGNTFVIMEMRREWLGATERVRAAVA